MQINHNKKKQVFYLNNTDVIVTFKTNNTDNIII